MDRRSDGIEWQVKLVKSDSPQTRRLSVLNTSNVQPATCDLDEKYELP